MFVGAHADDVEIGCGGTIFKLTSLGWKVSIVVMTDDAICSQRAMRRKEAISSALHLGVHNDQVHFLDFSDGYLVENSDSVSRTRKLFRNIGPIDLVFVHTTADSHGDHRACAGIIRAALRSTLVLGYAVTNSVALSDFRPKVFFDITNHRVRKQQALRKYETQIRLERIHWSEISRFEQCFGTRSGLQCAEAMELVSVPDKLQARQILFALNDSRFSAFWTLASMKREIVVIESLHSRPENSPFLPVEFKESEGLEALRKAFFREWVGEYPVTQISSASTEASRLLNNSCVVVSGGPSSNQITHTYFNEIPYLRYIVGSSKLEGRPARIFDREKEEFISAEYRAQNEGKLLIERDFGVLSIVPNPFSSEPGILVGCMGIHSLGTKGCLLALSNNSYLRDICSLFVKINRAEFSFGQVLISITHEFERIEIHELSHYRIDSSMAELPQ